MLAAAAIALSLLGKAPSPGRFLAVDAHRHRVTITLIASYNGTNGGFNFDGYSRTLMVTVPKGWRVRVNCENRGPLRHSCAVVKGPASTRAAFRHAETAHPFVGLEAGQRAHFTFRATRTGVFRFACLVPGHEAARMYDVLKIVRGGKPAIRDLRARS
ncbi:MAG TPA: cupredoxin domain-containing protein [Gaiellaceae bacterium]|nr:cupredoxin domain-containing protein [Gaiellaceae bacterium]